MSYVESILVRGETISDQRRDAAVSSFISRQEQDPCRSFRLLAGPSRDVITTRHLSPSFVFTAFAGDFFCCPVKTRNRARQLCREEQSRLSLSLNRTTRSCVRSSNLFTFISLLYRLLKVNYLSLSFDCIFVVISLIDNFLSYLYSGNSDLVPII